MIRLLSTCLATLLLATAAAQGAEPWVTYQGGQGPGFGKKVVLLSGDEEYRSEEALPQLAKILAKHHGFTCTVLFAVANDGTIDPNRPDNIPGLEALRTADLMVIATRFRDLPDDQMKEVIDYVDSGRPVIGLRTATHAFSFKPDHKTYARYTHNSKVKGFEGGFGRMILGETWVNHHGDHNHQSTRGILAPGESASPILRGIKDGDIWGPTDVYSVRLPLTGDGHPLVLGQVVEDMTPGGKPLAGPKNDPMMPIAWTRTYTSEAGKVGKAFTTTMGAATDLESAGVRRLLVNASYWAVGLEDKIPPESEVGIVGEFKPRPFGNNKFEKGVKPERHAGLGD